MKAFRTALAVCLLAASYPSLSWAGALCTLDRKDNIGKPVVVACNPGREMINGLCYDKCPDGWKGVVTQCIKPCPDGFADNGLYCKKPAAKTIACPQGYRDDGKYCYKPDSVRKTYPWQVGDRAGDYSAAGQRCKQDFPQQGCTQDGLLWHPNACPSGWDDIGVSCAKPDAPEVSCPRGFDDIGVSCQKPSKDRGAGKMDKIACSDGSKPRNGLCYAACPSGYEGTDAFKPYSAACVAACPGGTVKGAGDVCCSPGNPCPTSDSSNLPTCTDFVKNATNPADVKGKSADYYRNTFITLDCSKGCPFKNAPVTGGQWQAYAGADGKVYMLDQAGVYTLQHKCGAGDPTPVSFGFVKDYVNAGTSNGWKKENSFCAQ